mmetsp:Transcript_62929/g.116990  ORF Transcript_62929/g.116990 Transcript_62929/m.116990 type:complete len:273 (+) Transcript_62929:183-1001(+)
MKSLPSVAARFQGGGSLFLGRTATDSPPLRVVYWPFRLVGGLHMQAAGRELRAHPDIVLAAASQNGMALEFASEDLRADHNIVLAAVSQNGLALQFAAEEFRAHHDIVMAAVSQNGTALRFAVEELRADCNIVSVAVSSSGLALMFADEGLRAHRDIVLAAVAERSGALKFASDSLLQDETFAPEARQHFYLFSIVAMSGRSCCVACDARAWISWTAAKVSADACRKLGMERRNNEMLLYGSEIVPAQDPKVERWPGSPALGSITEYHLVRW